MGVYDRKKERGGRICLHGSERQWESGWKYLASYMKDQKIAGTDEDTRTRSNPLIEMLYTRRW